ncbi:MAG TPA: ABC transporter permease subunit [Xanthobacteraceae bacterium]|jgi:NitT/TauT family transport system permease protein|nr:ABC transporter permease subunit [Xanthobacteraceae bacterium]
MRVIVPISVGGWARLFSGWDILALLLILGLLVFLSEASRHLFEPLAELQRTPPSLDPSNLPEYAARTTLRMLIAMVLSLLFTFTYATLAAKNKQAERLLVPLLDILQSVPILGFISITVVFFMALAPGRVLGAEFAAIFAIFTSQAWNMAFSFYQSLRTVPTELIEASRNFRLSPWMSFWRLDVPFAMPQLIWNMMMSMSGSWFFVVASEAISVGNTTVTLPGVGSYIALAIEQQNLKAVGWAIGTMLIVILIYDQILFRPLVAWADRFRFEQEPGIVAPRSWVLELLRRSRMVDRLTRPFAALWRRTLIARAPDSVDVVKLEPRTRSGWITFQWAVIVFGLAAIALWQAVYFVTRDITLADIGTTLLLGLATLTRVVVLIALASVIWVPIGVWVGTRPYATIVVQPIAQFLAAFPANVLFPIAVSGIVAWRLDPNIWLSPLMILGTQWYILFNVIAGAAAIPAELRAVGANLRVRGWLWWRRISLPAVLPYYVTGAITASGGSWNASIVAEVASWGNEHLEAKGLGAYIAQQTEAGDFHRIVLGIAVMSLYVVVINRLFWRPLYRYAERKFRLD